MPAPNYNGHPHPIWTLSREAEDRLIRETYETYIDDKSFPCIAAKAARSKNHIRIFLADHIACPKDDAAMLRFLYGFVDAFREAPDFFHSAAVIFRDRSPLSEDAFDHFLWRRLQALTDMDAKTYPADGRVSADPAAADFSFSLKSEAFYIIGLHPGSSRDARRFDYPALVFNPHAQFEQLRASGRYQAMKEVIRKRDVLRSGSVNPMLEDFGRSSEVFQYSGREYDRAWKCPLISPHGKPAGHSAP